MDVAVCARRVGSLDFEPLHLPPGHKHLSQTQKANTESEGRADWEGILSWVKTVPWVGGTGTSDAGIFLSSLGRRSCIGVRI